MKKCFLLLIGLISISAHAAMQYSGTAKIVDHVEEHHVPLPKELATLFDDSKKNLTSSVLAIANPSYGRAGTTVYATCDVSWYLKNETNKTLVYYPESYCCISKIDCYHGKDTVIAKPYDIASSKGQIFTSSPIAYPGVYANEALMQITGAEKQVSNSVNKIIVN